MLVATLEINIGLPVFEAVLFGMMQLGPLHDNRARAGTGIDPYIERVGGFGGGLGAGPVVGLHRRPQRSGVALKPHIRSMLLNQRGRVANNAGVEHRLSAGIKRRDWHAPRALTADAPVGT